MRGYSAVLNLKSASACRVCRCCSFTHAQHTNHTGTGLLASHKHRNQGGIKTRSACGAVRGRILPLNNHSVSGFRAGSTTTNAGHSRAAAQLLARSGSTQSRPEPRAVEQAEIEQSTWPGRVQRRSSFSGEIQGQIAGHACSYIGGSVWRERMRERTVG